MFLSRIQLAVVLTASLALGACAESDGTEGDSQSGAATADVSKAGALKVGHYKWVAQTPTPGALVELVLKNGTDFEARSYAFSFWQASPKDEEVGDFKGTYKIVGNDLTLLTSKLNAYGVYTFVPSGAEYKVTLKDEPGSRPYNSKFSMKYADASTTLSPMPSGKDPGTPPAMPGGRQLHCESGLYATNLSINKTGGWMYHFTENAPKTIEKVKLYQSPAENSTSAWLRFVGDRVKASGDDYEVGIPTSLLNAGTKDVDVTIAFGNASRGVFTNDRATCTVVQ